MPTPTSSGHADGCADRVRALLVTLARGAGLFLLAAAAEQRLPR